MAPTKPAKKKAAPKSKGFTAAERAAMRARAKELKSAATKEEAEREVVATIKAMPKADRVLGQKLHAIVKANAPGLAARLWYGMPAYADGEGKVVCHFQPADKFKTRYATFGFSDRAGLDNGALWPVVFALTEVSPATEKKITALVKKAVR